MVSPIWETKNINKLKHKIKDNKKQEDSSFEKDREPRDAEGWWAEER